MQYVNLGRTGMKVSPICFGTAAIGDPSFQKWALGKDDARALFRRAFDAGINFFDTADRYSTGVSEEITGALLKETASRTEVILATKVCGPMGDGPQRRRVEPQAHP